MRKALLPAYAAALVAAAPAMAGDFNYNLLEFGLVDTSVDDQSGDLDSEGDGVSLGVSAELGPHVFGFARLGRVRHELKYYDEEFRIGQGALGLGFALPLGSSVDLVGGVSLQRLRFESDLDTFSGNGHGLELGLRGGSGRVEWNLGARYTDLNFELPEEAGFVARDTMYVAGGRYRLARHLWLGVDLATNGDDETSAAFVFRWSFNERD